MVGNDATGLARAVTRWVDPASADRFSLVIPVYNEEESLTDNLQTIRAFLDKQANSLSDAEIIIVNDGSIDATAQVAERVAGEDCRITVYHHKRNLGLGRALATGFNLAQGNVIITLDSDLTYAVSHIGDLVQAAQTTGAQVVVTSPYMSGGTTSHVPLFRLVLSRSANRLLSLISGGRLSTFTGMVRLYRREFLDMVQISASGAEANLDLLNQAFYYGVKVTEIPAHLDWGSRRLQNRSQVKIRSLWRQTMQVIRYGRLIRRTCVRR